MAAAGAEVDAQSRGVVDQVDEVVANLLLRISL